MSDPVDDSEKRLGQWLTDLMGGKITMPSRLHEDDELGHVIDGKNEWPHLNLDPPK